MKKLLLFVFVLMFSHSLFPQVTLLSPNGGEIWLAGSTQNVSWADVNASTGYVNLDYSTDNGVTWNRFANSASSMYPTYSWWIPTLVGTTYKVRVTDANNSFYSDESDAPFTITDQLPPTLTLTYPNGGEIIYSGSQQNITWTSSNIGSINLYFSPDNGVTWNSIATNLPAYMESYSSIVTSGSTNNAIIRISDASDAATFDESDGVFTILDTTKHKITVSFPNGGENLQVGSEQSLAWTNTNMTGTVNIDYSTDNGTNWFSVASNLPSMYPTYLWTIPNTPSTNCKIKVYDVADQSIFDESDAPFTITTSLTGGVVAHYNFNGDATDGTGNGHDGTVNGALLVPDRFSNPNSAYSFPNPSRIAVPHSPELNFPGGKFTFTVWMKQEAGSNAFNCILGKDYTQEFGFGTWGTDGTAPTYPRLTIGNQLTPSNNASPINSNTWYHIAVTFDDSKDEVQFFINGLLTETETNTGSITPTTTELGIGSDGKYFDQFSGVLDDIRIFDHVLTSAEIFSIYNDSGILDQVLELETPNGGEYLVAGTTDTIHWFSNYLTQVKLDYTTDYGATWTNIVGSMPAEYPDGYAWVVPNTPSTFCKVRVTDNNNPDSFDESDSVFTIQLFKSGEYTPDANTVLLDHFNATTDATVLAFKEAGLPCGSENPSAAPNYSFSPGMNELNYALNMAPPVGEPQGSSTYLKYPGGQVLSQANGTIEFWIYLPSYEKGLSLVEQGPFFKSCAGWTFNMFIDSTGTLQSSAWAAFGMNSGTHKVPLNRWTHLAVSWGSMGAKMYIDGMWVGSDVNTGMPADGYSGSLLITLGTGAGVSVLIDELRVSNIQRREFNIIPQEFVSVASPNGGENLVAGEVDTIRWTSSNTSILNIEYSTDNGVNWISIYPAMPASVGSVPWLVPNTPSTSCKVKITDADNATIFDESDNVFTIAPQMFTDLVAYYPFMDGSLGDFSGNGNTASNFGGQLVADRFGNPNNAYYFNGDAYMSVPNSPSLQSPTNMVTLSGWVKNDVGAIYAVAVKSASSGLGQYRLYLTDYSVVFSSSIAADVSMPFTFEHGKWYFVAVTWDGTTINYFVNGNFIGSASSVGTLTPDTEPLVFGMDTPGLTEFTVGTIDDIRIYNRALPSAEIRALYHEGGWDIRMVDSGLVAYYPFNNNTVDESGNGNNGTNNGATPSFDRFNTPNSALSFDGNTNFVLVPSSSSLNVQNSITLSAWIKTDNPHIIQDVNPGSILAKHETVQTRQYDLFFYSTTYDSLHFDLVDERDNFSSDEYFFGTSTPSASYRNNQWHMVVGTYDYNTGFSSIYIDGVLTTSNYIGQINLMKTTVPLTIGCYSEQNSNFRGFYQGIIDDIRIYDRSLSQQEIMMLYYEKEYVPTSLTLTAPTGGEVYQANSPVAIEWSATNVYNFSLEYTSDNGASWALICDTLTSASTGFLWYTPYLESDMVRVRILDKNNPTLFDESDSNFTVTNKITQFIPLYYSGWNMTSFYVQPLSSLPRDVFPSPPVLQVKTELQSFDPSLPEFLNTLKNVNAAQGYLVKVDAAESYFEVTGLPFYPSGGLSYRAGWNLMSYYYSYGESVWYAFEPIMTSVEEIKTLTSYYNPLGSPETNTLYTLEPGEAYWLRLKNNIDGYVLPSPQAIMPKKHQTIGQKLMADLPWKLKGYPQSTVAIFTVTSNGKPVNAGSVVAAFVNNECRAISEVKLNSEGTAFATLVINGDKEEEVSFKIFDAVKKEAFGSNLKIKTKPGTTIPGIQELPFTFVTGVEDPILPTTTTLMNAYPNPFNPETRIRYELNKDQHVSLKIYDVLGKEVITLVDDTKNAGYYEVSFDASGLPSGIYFYRMQSGEYVSVKKLLLLK